MLCRNFKLRSSFFSNEFNFNTNGTFICKCCVDFAPLAHLLLHSLRAFGICFDWNPITSVRKQLYTRRKVVELHTRLAKVLEVHKIIMNGTRTWWKKASRRKCMFFHSFVYICCCWISWVFRQIQWVTWKIKSVVHGLIVNTIATSHPYSLSFTQFSLHHFQFALFFRNFVLFFLPFNWKMLSRCYQRNTFPATR